MKLYYQQRMVRVMDYIQQNFTRPLTLEELASVGCLSSHHFHRVFKEYVGETIHCHIRRLRLEKAARCLSYGEESISQIAVNCGFETASAFARSFRQCFHVTPGEYRKGRRSTQDMACVEWQGASEADIIKQLPQVRVMKPLWVCYVRRHGVYHEAAAAAWQSVMQHSWQRGIADKVICSLGITYDDPTITDEAKIRYEACFGLPQPIESSGEMGVKQLEGGKYAVFTHMGPYHTTWKSYRYIYGQWLLENNIMLRDAPEYSRYLNHHTCRPDQSDLCTEIWVPIERA